MSTLNTVRKISATSVFGRSARISTARKIVYSIVSTVLVLLAIELVGRVLFFQRRADKPTFVQYFSARAGERLSIRSARKKAARMREEMLVAAVASGSDDQEADFVGKSMEELRAIHYADEPGGLLMTREEVYALYEPIFADFASQCQRRNIRLLVVHAPDPWTSDEDREFFAATSAKYKVPFIDMTEAFSHYPIEATHLMPFDGHPSSFGHKILADAIAAFLKPWLEHRSPQVRGKYPDRLGDHTPGRYDNSEVHIPYQSTITHQGFRSAAPQQGKVGIDAEVSQIKDPARSRILCIGDSVTFGSHVNDVMTYPSRLGSALPGAEIINAGTGGFTICDEFDYLVDRGVLLSPDIVILQVLNNDLYCMQDVWREALCRFNLLGNADDRGIYCFEPKSSV